MTKKNTDLTFFTNEENHNLLDRFKTTLTDTTVIRCSSRIFQVKWLLPTLFIHRTPRKNKNIGRSGD